MLIAVIIVIVVLLLFVLLPLLFGAGDKLRHNSEQKCKQIVEEKGGTLVSVEEEYHAMKRESSYLVKWMNSDGATCTFRYQPPYPIFTKESVTEL